MQERFWLVTKTGLDSLWLVDVETLLCCKSMGTTFVTLARGVSDNDPGFWMPDGRLELWLRLLALHLPELGLFGGALFVQNPGDRRNRGTAVGPGLVGG
jgi:hypothetical protein